MSLVACTHDLANIIDRENSIQYSFNELSDNWIGMDLVSMVNLFNVSTNYLIDTKTERKYDT
jgi:predicted metal-binding protein